MSGKLTLLLERINANAESLKPMSEEEMARRDSKVMVLVRRIENRNMLEETKKWTLATVKSIKDDLRLVNHVLKCGNCLFELIFDVERYGGSRSGLACLDLANNEFLELYADDEEEIKEEFAFDSNLDPQFIEFWRQIPRVENYRIGSYWTGTSEDTTRFVKDRLEWFRKMLLNQLKLAREHYRLLLKWNVDQIPPSPYTRVI